MNKLIIANWKMNFTLSQAFSFCQIMQGSPNIDNLIICVPSLYLALLAEKFHKLKFAAQNISVYENFGAYTGQYSNFMVQSCKIDYVLLGHSECRKAFNETNRDISIKVANCLKENLIPIICVGESLASRDSGNHLQDIIDQLTCSLPQNISEEANIIIAYEPIWAIGTGLVANDWQILEVFTTLSSFIQQSLFANKIQLVYGGSANIDNMSRILMLDNVDGLLLGKASLNVEQMYEMLNFKIME